MKHFFSSLRPSNLNKEGACPDNSGGWFTMSGATTNSHTYTLYKLILKGKRMAPIGWLLILPFMLLYTVLGGSKIPLNTLWEHSGLLAVFLAGDYDHLKNKRWLLIVRVSTKSQGSGPSLDEQRNQTKKMAGHFDPKSIEIITFSESATTLDKEQFDKIRRKARNDEFDILAGSQLNRLTRADPWEALDFMRTIYENNIVLCTAENGPYDWDDIDDFDEITTKIVLSRKHVLDIREGQKRNWRPIFEEKKWPQGKKPPTLMKLIETDGDYDEMRLKTGAEKVANIIYDVYVETENMAEVHRHIEKQLPIGDVDSISYQQVLELIGDRQLTGRFPKTGEILVEHDDLRVISDEKYEQAVEIRESNTTSEQEDPLESAEALSAHARRFGPLSTLLNVLTRFHPVCNCGTAMKWDGDKTGQSLGVTVPKFECTECEHSRAIPSKEAMGNMIDVLPLRCPYCIGTGHFTSEEIKSAAALYDYRYECDLCGHSWGSNMEPDKIRRTLDHPELRFSIDDDSLEPERSTKPDNRNLGEFI